MDHKIHHSRAISGPMIFPLNYPTASIHPDYAGGRQFQKEMFTSGRYDMPDVYKRGMSFDSQTSF